MPQITARDTATGKTVTFNWNGDGQPTDADMADVFRAAQGDAYKPSGPQPRGWQPIGSHGGAEPEGAQKSGLLSALEPIAHPSSMSDFASLLIPSAALGTGLRSLRGWMGAGKNLVQGAAEGAANREGLKKIPATLKGMADVATDAQTGGQRAFQEQPLAQQMEHLPNTAAPSVMRGGGPIASGMETPTPPMPFHEQPLYQQMEHLADTPVGVGSQRSGMPHMSGAGDVGLEAQVADAARRNRLSPEAQAKLLKQLQLSNLVKIGPETP